MDDFKESGVFEEKANNKTDEVFNYQFFAPERINTKDLHEDKFDQALKFSEERVQKVTNYVADLKPFCQKIEKNSSSVLSQDLTDQLDKLEESLLQMVQDNYDSLCGFEKSINESNDDRVNQEREVAELKKLKEKMEKSAKDNLSIYKSSIDDLAYKSKMIDIFSLESIFPPAEGSTWFHEIFSWCVEILYESPTTSYEWNNFKEECFVQDYGVDFLARLRGLNIAKFSNYQYSITKQLTNYFSFLKREVQNSEFHKLLDCISLVVDAYEARKTFLDDKASYEQGLKKYEVADIAVKVEKNLRESHSEFVCFSTSVQNTLKDTLDWYCWCNGKYIPKENPELIKDCFVKDPLNIDDYLKDKTKTIKIKPVQDVNLMHSTFKKTDYVNKVIEILDDDDLLIADETPINKVGWQKTKAVDSEQHVGVPVYYERAPAPESVVPAQYKFQHKCTIF